MEQDDKAILKVIKQQVGWGKGVSALLTPKYRHIHKKRLNSGRCLLQSLEPVSSARRHGNRQIPYMDSTWQLRPSTCRAYRHTNRPPCQTFKAARTRPRRVACSTTPLPVHGCVSQQHLGLESHYRRIPQLLKHRTMSRRHCSPEKNILMVYDLSASGALFDGLAQPAL